LILQCYSDSRQCETCASFRGFRTYVHRPHGPVRPMSPVCGALISRISLSVIRVVRLAQRCCEMHHAAERDAPPLFGAKGDGGVTRRVRFR
jgi:hypothetical protein